MHSFWDPRNLPLYMLFTCSLHALCMSGLTVHDTHAHLITRPAPVSGPPLPAWPFPQPFQPRVLAFTHRIRGHQGLVVGHGREVDDGDDGVTDEGEEQVFVQSNPLATQAPTR